MMKENKAEAPRSDLVRRRSVAFVQIDEADGFAEIVRAGKSFTQWTDGEITLIGDTHVMPDGGVCVNFYYPADFGSGCEQFLKRSRLAEGLQHDRSTSPYPRSSCRLRRDLQDAMTKTFRSQLDHRRVR